MLLFRSIALELCLLLIVGYCAAQGYDYEEDHADVAEDNEELDHPDYSKYYSIDGGPSKIQDKDGFVAPIDFNNFFGPSPIVFGESNQAEAKTNIFVPQKKLTGIDALKQEFPEYYANNPFPKDYFEEAQKQQEEDKDGESSEVAPGPSYIGTSLPSYQYKDEEDYRAAAQKEQVETITVPPQHRRKKPKKDYDFDDEDATDESSQFGKFTDYNVGKSSSSVSQYPTAEGLYNPRTTTLSPYRKYSFQNKGSKYLEPLISTAAPFNPTYAKVTTAIPVYETQSSEQIPKHLQGKGCKKIKKPVSEAEAVNCFVCEDPENKSKYTQCSYAASPKPVEYYTGKSERYSTPAKEGDGFRFKRYSEDPYEYIKQRSQANFDRPSEEKYSEDFQYTPEYDSTEEEKSFSEQQSEELRKNPENCKKIEKSGMTCTICKNAKTGGNFEQCSYTSEPKEEKYAYVKEKKYDSNDPDESKTIEKAKAPEKKSNYDRKHFKQNYEPVEQYEGKIKTNKRPERQNKKGESRGESRYEDEFKRHVSLEEPKEKIESETEPPFNYDDVYRYNDEKQEKKLVEDDPYDVPKHFAASTKSEKQDGGGKQEEPYKFEEFDEYHFKLFPEFANAESRQDEAVDYAEPSKSDVAEVLAEFSKKDRSNCKKAEKHGMTCYLCVDENKIQHEECMFVQESQPKSSHIAYHEVKAIKEPEKEQGAETKTISEKVTTTAPVSKRKRFFKKATAVEPLLNLEHSASEDILSTVNYEPKKKTTKKSKYSKEKKQRNPYKHQETDGLEEENEPTVQTPAEFEVADDEGAFSDETRPVYSKAIGMTLPKYMLEKSEFEKEFDAFAVL